MSMNSILSVWMSSEFVTNDVFEERDSRGKSCLERVDLAFELLARRRERFGEASNVRLARARRTRHGANVVAQHDERVLEILLRRERLKVRLESLFVTKSESSGHALS